MTRPMLQLALDLTDLKDARRICAAVAPYVDWIEVGTPLLVSHGLDAVRLLRQEYPEKRLVVDVKIADSARLLSEMVFAAGADIVTVLASASDKTIATCVEVANQAGKQAFADLLGVRLNLSSFVRLAQLGAHFVGVHLPKDLGNQEVNPNLDGILANAPAPIILAGGLDIHKLTLLRGQPLQAVVIGGAILNATDPALAAQEIALLLSNWTSEGDI